MGNGIRKNAKWPAMLTIAELIGLSAMNVALSVTLLPTTNGHWVCSLVQSEMEYEMVLLRLEPQSSMTMAFVTRVTRASIKVTLVVMAVVVDEIGRWLSIKAIHPYYWVDTVSV